MPLEIALLGASETRSALANVAPNDLVSSLRTAFAGLATGSSVQPATAVTDYPDGAGDCVYMSALQWDLDLLGVKVSPYVVARSEKGLDPVTAYTLILQASTGEPILLCDSMALTSARTGATTALGVDYLAAPDATSVAVVGAGKVAVEHLRHITGMRAWTNVRIFSPALTDASSDRRREFEAARSGVEEELGVAVDIADTIDSAVLDADVVLGCTSANAPIFDVATLKPSVLVTSVTSDIRPAHEVSPQQISQFDVYCDYKPAATAKSHELIEAAKSGNWSFDDIVADLSELATQPVNIDFSKPRYFRNHGVAIEDIVVASLIIGNR